MQKGNYSEKDVVPVKFTCANGHLIDFGDGIPKEWLEESGGLVVPCPKNCGLRYLVDENGHVSKYEPPKDPLRFIAMHY